VENFVYIIGYQFERVHTGMIKWLLDWDNTEISKTDKLTIIENFYKYSKKAMPFNLNHIDNITCISEYSFGKRLKIDLVVKLELEKDKEHYLVMEMKVDSIPYEDQLKSTKNIFESNNIVNAKKTICADYFLLLFGSSFACDSPGNRHDFSYLKLDDIISVFSGLTIKNYPYRDWIVSLEEELKRYVDVKRNIELLPSDSIYNSNYWLKNNYRIYLPLFYYIYDDMRKHYLDRKKSWSIYSGINNPVMNWNGGWIGNDEFELFWEFNYESFILKMWIDKNKISREQLNNMREKLYPVCEKTSYQGVKTYRKYSEYNSIFKWDFDFKKMDFEEIAKTVDNDILSIHSGLLKHIDET